MPPQAKNGGSLVSFTTENIDASKCIVEDTKLFKVWLGMAQYQKVDWQQRQALMHATLFHTQVTVSFGNVMSQISLPCFMSHASIPAEVRAARGLPDDLIRISCGIEDADDLIAGALTNHVLSEFRMPRKYEQ